MYDILYTYEGFKEGYLDTKTACAADVITVIPMVVDTCDGGWDSQACTIWEELAKTTALATGEIASLVSMHLSQSLSIVVCRENAQAVLRRAVGRNPDYAPDAVAEVALNTT